MGQSQRWLNPKMFYEMYGVSISTQAKWRMNKVIVFSKVEGFVWYDRIKIDKWLEEKEVTATKKTVNSQCKEKLIERFGICK